MRIGLLKCATVENRFMHISGDYTDMFIRLFSDARISIELIPYDVTEKEYPASLDEVDGFISTGSRHSVYDDLPWIARFRDFVEKLHKEKKKFVGICFGHQMMAHALGGRVTRMNSGWAVGTKKTGIIRPMPWMEPELNEYSLYFMHRDHVEKLPPDAELLGSNDYSVNSMFQTGTHFLGIQAHPEFEENYTKELMLSRSELIGREKIDEALLTMDTGINRLEVANWIYEFYLY